MPQAAPIIVGYLASEGAVAAGGWWAANAAYVGAAAAAASAAAMGAAEQRKARKRAQSARRDITVMVQTGSGPRRTVYGRAKLSGPLVYAYSNGEEHKYLHRIIALTGHEIDGFDRIYFNDDDITGDFAGLPSSGPFSSPTVGGRYMWAGMPVAHVSGYVGTSTQSADATLITASGGQWTSDHRLLGCSYVRVQNNYEPIVYTEGLPNPAFVIRGKKLYDGRTGLTAWSANTALVVRDYLINELGVPAARIDQASFNAAANVCDEWVTVDVNAQSDPAAWLAYLGAMVGFGLWEYVGSGVYQQRRYTFNGVIEADDAPGEVLDQMVQACAGWLSYTGGAWRLVVGGYTAPTITLGDRDLRGAPTYQPRPARRQCFNVVRGTFSGPATRYVATDFPAPISSAYVAQDGGQELPLDIDLPFSNDGMMAQRIASILLARSRQGVLLFPATLSGLALRPGDTVYINLPRFGFTTKVFRVEGWSLSEDYGVDLVLREDAAAYYNWSPYGPLYDQSPELNLPNPWLVPAVTGLTATSGVNTSLIQNDGTIVQRTLISWTPTTNAFARIVQLQSRMVGETAWTPQPDVEDAAGQCYLLNLRAGASYEIRARRLNTVGAVGQWVTVNHTPAAVNSGVNFLRNSDWTEDSGYPSAPTAYYNDTRALRHWLPGGNVASYGRNYDNGKTWNIGLGGCSIYIPSNTVGHYAYIYQDIEVVAGIAYEASVSVATHRAITQIQIQYLNAAKNTLLGNPSDTFDSGVAVDGDPYNTSTHRRLWCTGAAPASTVYARVILLVLCTNNSTPYPWSGWHRAMFCVAPPGVTRETATPWLPDSSLRFGETAISTVVVPDNTALGRAGSFFDWTSNYTQVASITFTPTFSGTLVLRARGMIQYTVNDTAGKSGGTTQSRFGLRIAVQSEVTSGSIAAEGIGPEPTVVTEAPGFSVGPPIDFRREFQVVAGTSYTWSMWGQKAPSLPTTRSTELFGGKFELFIKP